MKFYIFIFTLFFGLYSCKNQPKNTLGQAGVIQEKQKQKELRPTVSSINGKYLLEDSTQIKIFAQIVFDNLPSNTELEKLNQYFKVQWTIQPETGIKEKLKSGRLEFSDQIFKKNNDKYELSFYVQRIKEQEGGILIIDFIDSQSSTKYTFDLPLDFHAKKIDTRYGLFSSYSSEFPQFVSFVNAGQEFVIKSLKPSENELFLIHYENNSMAALSPMSSSKRDPLSEFKVIDTLKIKNGSTLKLPKEGLYVLTQSPQTPKDGYGFMVVNSRFPRLTMSGDLRDPLVYLSTPKEIELLNNTQDPKEAIDLYFLNVAKGNQALAKQLIKAYFRRVAEANNLFTNYKEGWKTDKGMVYIVMGPPSRVQRNRQREVWLYSQGQNNSEIIYTFYRKANLLTDQNYELVRYPEYSSYWYPYVEAWRTGNVVE